MGTVGLRMHSREAITGLLAACATALLIGVPTDVIANPWFTRQTPVRGFDVAVLVALSALTGALVATYVMAGGTGDGPRRAGIGSGVLGWFAISCPACNKIVVALIGASGATGTFAGLQPVLGGVAVALAAGSLAVRVGALRRGACPLPPDA